MTRTGMWIVIVSAATLAGVTGVAPQATSSGASSSRTTTTTRATTASSALNPADRRFMEETARASMAEIRLGRLATERGTHGDVRAFGQMMVDDHQAARQRLQAIAANKGVTLPTGPSQAHLRLEKRLRGMSGMTFDRAYLSAMVREHRKDVTSFRNHTANGRDPDVTRFASETLPRLQLHLQEAQRLSGTLAPAMNK